jgi:hypothetical protein
MMGSMSGSGTVSVTGNGDYEPSLKNSSFSPSVVIPYVCDTLASTNVYIRLRNGLLAGAYSHQSLSVTATGSGVFETIDVSGLVTPTPISLYFNNTTATTIDVELVVGFDTTDVWEYKVDQMPADPTTGTITTTKCKYHLSGLSPNTLYQFHFRRRYDGRSFLSRPRP